MSEKGTEAFGQRLQNQGSDGDGGTSIGTDTSVAVQAANEPTPEPPLRRVVYTGPKQNLTGFLKGRGCSTFVDAVNAIATFAGPDFAVGIAAAMNEAYSVNNNGNLVRGAQEQNFISPNLRQFLKIFNEHFLIEAHDISAAAKRIANVLRNIRCPGHDRFDPKSDLGLGYTKQILPRDFGMSGESLVAVRTRVAQRGSM